MTLEEIIQQARQEYATDGIDFDDYPDTSVSDDGTWVKAWVWVPEVPDENCTDE